MALLRQSRATGQMPTDKTQIIHATRQLVAYSEACAKLLIRLEQITPVAANEEQFISEYPL